MEHAHLKALLVLAGFIVSLHALAYSDDPSDIRAKLAAVAVHEAKDLPDYLARINRVEILIPQIDDFYAQSGKELERLRKKYESRPDLLQLADFIRSLNERDVFGFQLLKEEVRLAKRLSGLPANKQQDFFDRMILPLQHVEENVAEEEVEMAAAAIDRGIPLPKDIVESLRVRQGHR